MSNKLFVGNLSFNTTENDLQDMFAAHGTVVEANLMVDRVSGRAHDDIKTVVHGPLDELSFAGSHLLVRPSARPPVRLPVGHRYSHTLNSDSS